MLGTKSVLSACKNTFVKNFIFSSTAAVYKDTQKVVHEESKVQPKSVYGQTKMKAEKLIILNCKKLKINYEILRYFNVAGADSDGEMGQEKTDSLFKNIAVSLMKKKPIIKIKKICTQVMEHVLEIIFMLSDLAKGHIRALQKIAENEEILR